MKLAFASTAIGLDASGIGIADMTARHAPRGLLRRCATQAKSIASRVLAALASNLASKTVPIAATRSRPIDLAGGDRTVSQAAQPLSKSDEWQRVVRPLEAAAGHARAMCELQSAAGKQLLSVDYALEQLIDDLTAVMTVPRAPRASVHVLPVEPVRFAEPSPAARARKVSIAA